MGQKPHVVAVGKEIKAKFPGVLTIGGYRPGDPQDHGKGLALDVMVSPLGVKAVGKQRELGDSIATWAQANQAQLGITYIIWQNQIWNIARANEGWRSQGKKGNTNAHYDHVHISFSPTPGTGNASAPVGSNQDFSGNGNAGTNWLNIASGLTSGALWWRVVYDGRRNYWLGASGNNTRKR